MIVILTPPRGLNLKCDDCGLEMRSHSEIHAARYYLDPSAPAVLCCWCAGRNPPSRGRRRRDPSRN